MISYRLRAGQLKGVDVDLVFTTTPDTNTAEDAAILSVAKEMLKVMCWLERNPCTHPANVNAEAKRVMQMYNNAKEVLLNGLP